jgi:hypothetical protein
LLKNDFIYVWNAQKRMIWLDEIEKQNFNPPSYAFEKNTERLKIYCPNEIPSENDLKRELEWDRKMRVRASMCVYVCMCVRVCVWRESTFECVFISLLNWIYLNKFTLRRAAFKTVNIHKEKYFRKKKNEIFFSGEKDWRTKRFLEQGFLMIGNTFALDLYFSCSHSYIHTLIHTHTQSTFQYNFYANESLRI